MKYQTKTPAQLIVMSEISKKLKVLAHPTRLLIVDYLRQMKQQQSVTEIYVALSLPQAICSQHLIQMKDRGILRSQKIGTKIYYSVEAAVSIKVVEVLEKEGA